MDAATLGLGILIGAFLQAASFVGAHYVTNRYKLNEPLHRPAPPRKRRSAHRAAETKDDE